MKHGKYQQEKSPTTNHDLEETYNKYSSPLRNFIRKRIPSREDCEDILQNVFYQLSKVDQEDKPIEQISSWLYQVARNQIIDKSRKHREVELYRDEDGDEIEFVKEVTDYLISSNSPEKEFIKSLIWHELDIVLSELPTDQRRVFELNELEGISFKEISCITGIGVNTLISQKRYAVLALRERLSELYEDLLSS